MKSPSGLPQFDPSKMDPKLLMELTQLIRQLPPEKLSRMQTLMHNMMAGFDVRQELEEFEKTLPPGFREKLFSLMASQPDAFSMGSAGSAPDIEVSATQTSSTTQETAPTPESMNLHEARMTILKAVAEGRLPPEEAERLLFSA